MCFQPDQPSGENLARSRAQLPAAFCDSGQAQRARQSPRLQQVLYDFGAEHSFVHTTGADAMSGDDGNHVEEERTRVADVST